MLVTLSLFELDGSLRSGAKSLLQDVRITGVVCPVSVKPHGQLCLIIDGNALLQAIGKPHEVLPHLEIGLTSLLRLCF